MSNRNIEMTLIKALGIIVVVSCHLGINIFNFIGIPISTSMELLPEYSYHMPLFIFASGYFYKRIHESNILKLTQKRFLSIKKYAKCNLFYLVLSFILVNLGLLTINTNFNLQSFFIEPFLGGFQYYFNGPAWFVPFLFLLQISYTGMRKLIGLKIKSFSNKFETTLKQESILLAILIFIGIISAAISNIYPVTNGNVNVFQSILRILFGLQFFQLGFLYKEFFEEEICLSVRTFLVVLACRLGVYIVFGYYTFSLRTIQFNEHSILPFFVSTVGIIYCLHLVKFIIKIGNKFNSKIVSLMCIIGNNTWSIMMHHLLVKWCLSGIYSLGFIPESLANIGSYLISPILCIVLPIGFAYIYDNIGERLKKHKLQNKNKYIGDLKGYIRKYI